MVATIGIRGRRQWERCGFAAPGDVVRAALVDDVVALARVPPPVPPELGDAPFIDGFAGLAFDAQCRLFHPLPEAGAVELVLWGRQTALRVQADAPHPFPITGADTEVADFAPIEALPRRPIALGADASGYLYLTDADAAAPALWLIDIGQREVARRIPLPAMPRDVALSDGAALVIHDAPGLLRAGPCTPAETLAWPAGLAAADRITLVPGPSGARALLLFGAGTAAAELVGYDDTTLRLPVPFATDLDARGSVLAVARRPGEEVLVFRVEGRRLLPLPPLRAAGYDGRGVAWAPDGRLAYWTARGLRHAAPARPRYETNATVLGGALDSDRDANAWGRVRVEACIPDGTSITLRCVTADELEHPDPLARVAPAGEALADIALPELTPLPSALALAQVATTQALFRDATPPLQDAPAAPGFALYDAPVMAAPGRFLWLVFALRGDGGRTPRLRQVRVEAETHGLLRLLPRLYSREERARDFLGRYLAPPASLLAEWEAASAARHRVLDPRIAPAAALGWLGGWLGLAMDQCWPEAARRKMVREIARLFRTRGTVPSLTRMLEILTGGRVLIIERYRLRGGGVVGNPEATRSRAVLGAGFRVGGAIGEAAAAPPPPSEATEEASAHRFTVLLVASLSEAQLACARRLVETHKPAHTDFDICTVESGAKVGLGLHVGLASLIGRGSGFSRLTVGDSLLGRGEVLGRPALARPARDTGSGWRSAAA